MAREKAAEGGVDGLLGVEDLADAGTDDGDVVFAETAAEEGLARGGVGEKLVLRDGVDEVVQERAAFGGDGCVGEEGHANGKWGIIPDVLFTSDGTELIKDNAAWKRKMQPRWNNAPSVEECGRIYAGRRIDLA